MDSPTRVLIVDDDRDIRTLLAEYLEVHGYAARGAGDGNEMREAIARSDYDLIILDLSMPGQDGLELCRELRKDSDVPIVMLTARGDPSDRILGLETGADDYLAKPFEPRELLCTHVRNVLRRTKGAPGSGSAARRLRFGEWILDFASRSLVDRRGVVVGLSGAEFRLLDAFVSNPNCVLTARFLQLLDLTRGDVEAFDRSIDLQVSRFAPTPRRRRARVRVDQDGPRRRLACSRQPCVCRTVIAFARSMAGRVFFYIVFGVVVAFALSNFLGSSRINHPFVILAFFAVIFALSFLGCAPCDGTARPSGVRSRPASERHRAVLPCARAARRKVRRAATAFNAMQARIARDVRERTSLLAAITHDLHTPVTRLRLRMEKVTDEALRAKLVADLDAMRSTIREGLDLARSIDARETPQSIDLDSMLESVVADACEAGHDATLEGRTRCFVLGSPNGIRRCLTNVLDNAVAYGGCARVECAPSGDRAIVFVRDGGPGIPEAQLERVFEPFVRVENSRSRETGGTGIGLTIARNIVTRMGGTIALRNLPMGGLEVRLDLPADHTIG